MSSYFYHPVTQMSSEEEEELPRTKRARDQSEEDTRMKRARAHVPLATPLPLGNSATMKTTDVKVFTHLIAFMANIIGEPVDLCFNQDSVTINEINVTRTMLMCTHLDTSFFSDYSLSGQPFKLRLDLDNFTKLLTALKKNQVLNALIMCASDSRLRITAADGSNEPTEVSLLGLDFGSGGSLSPPQEVVLARLEVKVHDLVSVTNLLSAAGYSKVLIKLVKGDDEQDAPKLGFSGNKSAYGSENLTKMVHVHTATIVTDDLDPLDISAEFKVQALCLLFKGAKELCQTMHLELNRVDKPLGIILNLGVNQDDVSKKSSLTVHLMGLEACAEDE